MEVYPDHCVRKSTSSERAAIHCEGEGTHPNLQNDAASRINVEVVESVGVVARQSDTGHRLAKGNARAESSLAPELDESAAHSSVIIVVGAVTRYGGVPSAAGQARGPGSGMASGIVVVGVSAVELAVVD